MVSSSIHSVFHCMKNIWKPKFNNLGSSCKESLARAFKNRNSKSRKLQRKANRTPVENCRRDSWRGTLWKKNPGKYLVTRFLWKIFWGRFQEPCGKSKKFFQAKTYPEEAGQLKNFIRKILLVKFLMNLEDEQGNALSEAIAQSVQLHT